jgi:hypothetical protein
MGFIKREKFKMNYRVAKDNAVSELIDPANITGASFGFCLESDCVPQPDITIYDYKLIRYQWADSSTRLKITWFSQP